MTKSKKQIKADVSVLIKKIEGEAAQKGVSVTVHISEQSSDMRDMFVRWLQHDIKFMRSIKVYTNNAITRNVPPKKLRSLLDRLAKEADAAGESQIFYIAKQNEVLNMLMISVKEAELKQLRQIESTRA